jgi:hypothetical protein
MQMHYIQVDKYVERYCNKLYKFFPKSPPLERCDRMDASRSYRLANLVGFCLGNKVLFRYCNDMQIGALLMAVTGRKPVNGYIKQDFVERPVNASTTALSAKEIARYLGVSIHRYRRLLTAARKNVARAIQEN